MNSVKPYWSIFVSLLIVLSVVIIRALGSQSAQVISSVFLGKYDGKSFFYWPISRVSTECLIVPIGTLAIILIWILIRIIKRSLGINYITGYSILAMLILSVLAIIFTVFSGMGDPSFVQQDIATAQIRDTTYHLIGVYSIGGGGTYILVKCHTFNMNCQIDYVDKGVPPMKNINDIKLQISPSTSIAILQLVIGDQIVYSSK
jgi:hypothetical protein